MKIATNQLKIACASCTKKYHATCVNLTNNDISVIKENKEKWFCSVCIDSSRKLRSKSITDSTSGEKDRGGAEKVIIKEREDEKITLEKIMVQLQAILSAQGEAAVSINLCHEKIDEVHVQLRKQEEFIGECMKKVEALETQNVMLQKENDELKSRVNDMEQYSRRNCLELQGVPEAAGENVITVVQDVANAIGFTLESHMIDTCHRLGKNEARPSQIRGIIVKFVRRLDKEEFLRQKKIRRELKVSHLRPDYMKLVQQDNFIYVNESLTSSNRFLFAKAREFKKQSDIKFLWIRNGNIYMRVKEQSRVFNIKCVNDFKDVH